MSGGGVCVGSSDRSGGNNVGDECHIGIDQNEESSDQRFSEQEKKQFDHNKESSDQGFSVEEKMQFDSFDEVLKVVTKTGQPAAAKPKIQKVPSILRENDKFKKYFEPKVFSFGPFYHPQCTLEMAKQIKVILAADFLKKSDVKKDLYKDIKKQIKELKDCYDGDLTITYKDKDHELAWMFLVDGCAILQFMHITVNFLADEDTQLRNLGINFDYEEFLVQDVFLLENQLPYQLLQLIIGRASRQDELLKSIYKFIFYSFGKHLEWYKNKNKILEDLKHDHVHLLDLLRKKVIQPLHQKDHEKRDLIEIIIDWTVDLYNKLNRIEIIIWIVDLFNKFRNEFDQDWFPVPHRNIQKLREAGINLKHSKTSCVRDFSFSSGTLKLPRIILEESTTRMLMNMLGYEMCPDFRNGSEVSTYMYFMDELIDGTQDVEELREKKILLNQLGSDEEVVKLFNEISTLNETSTRNEISTHVFQNLDYYKVMSDIDNYFDNKGLRWLRKVSHDIHQYFKVRWSLLAFIGSLLILVSTIIQTVTTVLAYQADSKKGN